MTAIPALLVAADETKAILLTLEEFKRHDLTLHEARSDLTLLADTYAEADQGLARQLTDYLGHMLHRVKCNEISSEAAAQDIQRVITAIQAKEMDPVV